MCCRPPCRKSQVKKPEDQYSHNTNNSPANYFSRPICRFRQSHRRHQLSITVNHAKIQGMSNLVRVRIAPSPTGDPHVGTAYTALFNYVFAKQQNGKFILRIEDTDRTRFQEGSEQKIFDAIKWLGLPYDEGPDIGGPFGPYRQSERLDLYRKFALQLVQLDKSYYCFCTPQELEIMRKEQEAKHLPPMYNGKCKKIDKTEAQKRVNSGEKYVVRFNMPDTGETVFTDLIRGEIKIQNNLIDDQILLKSDGYPTYHLGVVVDDHLMGITHVIRAEEWISSVPKHIQIYKALGWDLPQFAHLPLLRNPDKSKISKRKNNTSLLWYKEQGYLPEALLNFFALLGYSLPNDQEIISLEELIKTFTFDRIVKSGPVFNLDKLDWLNGIYIRKKTDQELAELLNSYLPKDSDQKYILKIIPLVKERLKKLYDFTAYTDFFFKDPKIDKNLLVQKDKTPEDTKIAIEKAIELFSNPSNSSNWTNKSLEQLGRDFAEKINWKPADFFMTLRVALTGKTATPPLFETMEVLGHDSCINRLKKAILVLS